MLGAMVQTKWERQLEYETIVTAGRAGFHSKKQLWQVCGNMLQKCRVLYYGMGGGCATLVGPGIAGVASIQVRMTRRLAKWFPIAWDEWA